MYKHRGNRFTKTTVLNLLIHLSNELERGKLAIGTVFRSQDGPFVFEELHIGQN